MHNDRPSYIKLIDTIFLLITRLVNILQTGLYFTKNACISETKNDINFKFETMIDINDSFCLITTKFTNRVFYRPDLTKYVFYRPVCKINACYVNFFSKVRTHVCFVQTKYCSKFEVKRISRSKVKIKIKISKYVIKISTLLCKIHTRHQFEFKLCR